MDQSGVVQEALPAGQTCLAAVQGTLVVGQASLESRLLGLVESGGRCLICLYTHRRMAIAAEDLCLERVLRLEEGFALEEVVMETELPTLGSDVTIRIVSPEAILLVRLPFGSQTQTFLREIKVVWHVGILLLLCMRRELAANVSDVCGVTVGLLDGVNIKGAVAIHFRFHNTTICVVNAHLTAHPPESEQYSQDIHDICARLQFFQQDPSHPTIPLSQHDIVLWLGDLNSHLEQQDMDQVKKLVEAQEFRALYRHDQLKSQMEAKRVFEDFTEGEVIFQPTYKYKISSDEWDTSEQYCAFAWCDRILFKGETISQLDYRNHLSLRNSDHKPVSAVFDIACLPEPVICFELYDRCVESSGSYGLSSQLLSMLPECHKNVFNYLMAFLQELLRHSEKNHLAGHTLASVFGPVLLRPPPGHPAPDTAEKQKAQQFLQHFLFQEGSSP